MDATLQTLTPGSDAAIAQGCTCPVLDNSHGLGIYGGLLIEGQPRFWTNQDCPLHCKVQDGRIQSTNQH
jgi:hypothetical protein